MFCRICGKERDDDARFCPICGKELVKMMVKKTGKGVITLEMAAACYEQGKEVYKGNKTQTDAVKYIVKSTGMSKGSATIYTSIYRQMRDGGKIGYGMQVDHARYYFQHIYSDYGKSALRNALDAMQQYIDDHAQDLTGMQEAVDEYRGWLS